MATVARIVRLKRLGYSVQVEVDRPGIYWVDWPILYDCGKVAYDKPEVIPQFIRPKVRRLLEQAKDLNKCTR